MLYMEAVDLKLGVVREVEQFQKKMMLLRKAVGI